MPIREAGRQDLAERRILLKRVDVLVRDLLLLYPFPDLVGEFGRHHTPGLQGPEAFQKNGGGNDGGQHDRDHHRSAGFHDFEHAR